MFLQANIPFYGYFWSDDACLSCLLAIRVAA